MVLAQSKSSRWSFVGTVFQRMITAAPRHFQDLLVFVAVLYPLNRLIDVDCHPFLVVRERRVGPLEIAKLTHLAR